MAGTPKKRARRLAQQNGQMAETPKDTRHITSRARALAASGMAALLPLAPGEPYPADALDRVFAAIAQGITIRAACAAEGYDSAVLVSRAARDAKLADRLSAARRAGVECRIDDMFDTIQNESDVQRARLHVETLRWLASKLVPRQYGEKVEVAHSGSIAFTALVERVEARARGLVAPEQGITADGEDGAHG